MNRREFLGCSAFMLTGLPHLSPKQQIDRHYERCILPVTQVGLRLRGAGFKLKGTDETTIRRLGKLIANPNPEHTFGDLLYHLNNDLGNWGKAALWLYANDAGHVELRALAVHRMQKLSLSKTFPVGGYSIVDPRDDGRREVASQLVIGMELSSPYPRPRHEIEIAGTAVALCKRFGEEFTNKLTPKFGPNITIEVIL